MNPAKTLSKSNIIVFAVLLFLESILGTSAAKGDTVDAESVLTLPIQANLKVLGNRLNSMIPDTLENINEPNKVCVKAQWLKTKGIPKCSMKGIKIYCKDRWMKTKMTSKIRCDVTGWVRRNGDISSVSGNGSTLKFSLPIKVQITAKKKLVRETANATAIIYVSATPRINNDWSIAVDVALDFSWLQRPTLKLFGLIKVTIGSMVEPDLREKMDEFVKEIPGILVQLQLKEKVATIWSEIQNPIKLNSAPEIYVLFNPNSVAYSGFNIENNILKTAVSVAGKTQVILGKPGNPVQKTALVNLGSIPYQKGKFGFSLPVFVSYNEVLAIANKKFPDGYTTELENGPVKGELKISNPVIRKNNNEKLMLSTHINFDNRSKWLKIIDIYDWFDIDGKVTFKGIPKIDTSTRTLFVEKLEYDSSTNSELFDALVDVAGIKFIRDYLARQIAFKYGSKIDDGVAKVNESLNNITTREGIKVSASLQNTAIEQLTVNDNDIRIDTKLSGVVNASIGL